MGLQGTKDRDEEECHTLLNNLNKRTTPCVCNNVREGNGSEEGITTDGRRREFLGGRSSRTQQKSRGLSSAVGCKMTREIANIDP